MIFKRKSLLFWSLLPALLTLVVYLLLFGKFHELLSGGIQQLLVHWGWNPNGSASWISSTLKLASDLLLLVAAILTFSFTANLVSTPFNDFLAEKAERWTEPPLPPPAHPIPFFSRAQLRIIALDAVKTLVALTLSLFAFLISWIPLMGAVSFILFMLLITYQFISYAQTRRGIGAAQAFRFLLRNFPICFGFGLVTSFTLAIPVLSAFFLPVAVVGGTMLVGRVQSVSGSPENHAPPHRPEYRVP